jgi:uncharacterized protein
MDLVSKENGKLLARVIVADSFMERVFGLIPRKAISGKQCLLIKDCSSVHTIGMRYCLDAVFIDRHRRVIRVFKNLKPFRVTPYVSGAWAVLEFRAGFAAREGIRQGFVFDFKK